MYESYHETRFAYDRRRDAVWQSIVAYLLRRQLLREGARILDLGAGYCHFVNNFPSSERFALDLFPRLREFAAENVRCFVQLSDETWHVPDGTLDAVFASNFLEHLPLVTAQDVALAIHDLASLGRKLDRPQLLPIRPRHHLAVLDHLQVHETRFN